MTTTEHDDDTDISEEVGSDAWRRMRERNRRTTDQVVAEARARRAEDRREFEREHTMVDGDWQCRMPVCPWHPEATR